jgi:hypothetical protein
LLYATVGTTNSLWSRTNLSAASAWTFDRQIVMSNLLHTLDPALGSRRTLFFRARRE